MELAFAPALGKRCGVGGFKDHFSGVAANYAEFRPHYPRELFAWVASQVTSPELVWDCATGNGQAAVLLKEFFSKVIATDASATQLASARQIEGVTYVVASAERSCLPSGSIDCVTVAQAAHWFELPKFFAEAQRVMRPGGLLVLCCYGTFSFGHPQVDDLLGRFYSDIVGPYWPPERKFIEEGYRTIEFPLQEIRAQVFQMQATFTLERLLGYLRTWSATQRFIKAKGSDPVVELEKQLRPHWLHQAICPNSWPIHIRAGRFSK
jgi:ubiquinone/menaquinone biosynthesis C-methylase UbiE